MHSQKVIEDFNATIEFWIEELGRYDFTSLCIKPSIQSWSVGQVYTHLLEETHYYFEQAKDCVSSNDNMREEASADAKTMFLKNEFPDQLIEGPATNRDMAQPISKNQLINRLVVLKDQLNKVGILISDSVYKGKTRHPGLGYFNALEWFKFAEMHFRHHLRQKRRIDEFLKSCTN